MRAIDCDVHNEFRALHSDILDYLDPPWRPYITNGGFAGLTMLPYSVWQGSDRRETRREDGTRGGAYPEQMVAQHLNAWDIEYTVLTGAATAPAVCFLGQHDFAAAVARAINDYTVDVWLAADDRILGSIVVAAQHPQAAAREIDRLAEHPQFVQVILPMRSPGGVQWGDEKYHPIWRAAERAGLVVGFHANPIAGTGLPPTTAGWPRSYMELSAAYPIAAQSELIGLVCRGTFELFPELRVALIENGFGWAPSLLWRLDRRWRELRSEVPWLRRRPSEYVRERVRFTTQPMEEPDDPRHLLQVIDMFGSDEVLMFSSDYPHWDFDAPWRALPAALDTALRRRILSENARDFYRLRPRRSET
jgi:uncharacterized protein